MIPWVAGWGCWATQEGSLSKQPGQARRLG